MKAITIILMLICLNSIGQEIIEQEVWQEIIVQDTTPYTKYAILNISDYYSFNADISEAKGYDLGMSTERCFEMNASKYCLIDSILFIAVALNPENQQYYSGELFDINDVNFIDTVLNDVEIELIQQKHFNWFSAHYDKRGDKSKRGIFINSGINDEYAPKQIREKLRRK